MPDAIHAAIADAGEHDNHDAEKHDHDQGPGPNADDDDDKGAQAEDAGMGEAEPGGEEPEVDEDGPDTAMEDNQVPQNAMPGTNEGDGPDELEVTLEPNLWLTWPAEHVFLQNTRALRRAFLQDPQHAGVGDGEEQQTDYHDAAPEVGPEGMPNNATLSEEVLGQPALILLPITRMLNEESLRRRTPEINVGDDVCACRLRFWRT